MPILPGVDGVLFELLFLGAPLQGRDGLQPTEPKESSNNATDGGKEQDTVAHVSAEKTIPSQRRRPGTGSALDESDCLANDGVGDFRPCVFVGAVALLLSEIAGGWREMESPLFDRAGGISGTIKLAVRKLGGDPQETEAADAVLANESAKPEDGQETARSTMPQGAEGSAGPGEASAATGAAGSPLSTPERGGRDDGNYFIPKQSTDVREGQRDCRGQSASPSPGCCHGRGSARGGRLSPAELGFAEHRGAMNTTAAANEENLSGAVTADEMAPRAVIIYRGMRLPFRWFRSGTARGMDEALRETLGGLRWDKGGGWLTHLSPAKPLLCNLCLREVALKLSHGT